MSSDLVGVVGVSGGLDVLAMGLAHPSFIRDDGTPSAFLFLCVFMLSCYMYM